MSLWQRLFGSGSRRNEDACAARQQAAIERELEDADRRGDSARAAELRFSLRQAGRKADAPHTSSTPAASHAPDRMTRAGGTKKVIVARTEVESAGLSRVRAAVEAEVGLLAKGNPGAGDLVVTLHGYDSDPRELWQIPEVQSWFCRWHAAQPYAPYFLAPGSALLYVVAQIGAEPVTGGFRASRTSPRRFDLRREIDDGFKAIQKQLSSTALSGRNAGDFAAFVMATAPVAAFGMDRKRVLDTVFAGGDV